MTASLIGALVMGALKLKPKQRYIFMSAGFIGGMPFFVMAYLSGRFIPMCILTCFACFLNTAANAIFNATMMLALPEENRGAILGFVDAASMGGCALSALIYGFFGELFPLSIVFAAGTLITIIPMLIVCLNKRMKEFILTH